VETFPVLMLCGGLLRDRLPRCTILSVALEDLPNNASAQLRPAERKSCISA
jgi:hypothetical protein